MLWNLPAGGAERRAGPQPLEDLLEVAAMVVDQAEVLERESDKIWRPEEREREERVLFFFSYKLRFAAQFGKPSFTRPIYL